MPFIQFLRCFPVVPLIEVHAGFLPSEHVDQVLYPVNADGNFAGHTSVGHSFFQRQAFEAREGESFRNTSAEGLKRSTSNSLISSSIPAMPRVAGLVDENVSVAVDHKTRKCCPIRRKPVGSFLARVKKLAKTRRIEQAPAGRILSSGFLPGGKPGARRSAMRD